MKTLWHDRVTWKDIESRFRDHGVTQVQVKFLTRNHNSKNQIAGLGSDLTALSHLFPGPVTAHDATSGKPKAGPPIYRVSLPWVWFSESGLSPAPETKLIYYPQYPEIRLSGFLDASPEGPRELLAFSEAPGSRGQEEGRCLIFGPSKDKKVFAMVVSSLSPAAGYLREFNKGRGTLLQLSLRADRADSREVLFHELRLIHKKNWIEAYRLRPDGLREECHGTNSHGVTLESELGITANGRAMPDYLDWEVKAHRVKHLSNHLSSRITLLTPNPDSGQAKDFGTTWLTKTYGKPNETSSRYDLSGVHRAGVVHGKTGLEFGIEGFDAESQKITDDGYLYLRDPIKDIDLGRWSFSKLLTHWQAKHGKAVFVPCITKKGQPEEFSYGTRVHVGEGTSFLHFLAAVAAGSIVLDPGLNTKLDKNAVWKHHTRYQFRSSLTNAAALYRSFEKVVL
ncbi:MvaI/BcnI family restriction endonuclease [Arthrobacter sp. zg-Y1171]|uniref:MvaI/BcnI family restriction endonuclease n=2 Tax=Arthrobacter sp. zg-Y1171 TaxID=2964610 RepID=UPI002107CF5B|nr:MvaI/BcnI family restriction endonuclease [Arthrobacter sp. zg-Y1171]MCQ1996861.1 MvaI/BcnI restriction endonuclease family protein [Arthrobacter sp. zg-Y1171]